MMNEGWGRPLDYKPEAKQALEYSTGLSQSFPVRGHLETTVNLTLGNGQLTFTMNIYTGAEGKAKHGVNEQNTLNDHMNNFVVQYFKLLQNVKFCTTSLPTWTNKALAEMVRARSSWSRPAYILTTFSSHPIYK